MLLKYQDYPIRPLEDATPLLAHPAALRRRAEELGYLFFPAIMPQDLVTEVRAFFEERFETLTAGGIEGSRICFDPGIGFGKRLEHNLTLLAGLARLGVRDRPLLVGVSRKSFIGMVLEREVVGDREWPTVALTAYAREKGAMIHRVHSVRENREAMRMVEAVMT